MKNQFLLFFLAGLLIIPSCSKKEEEISPVNPFEYCITPASHDKLQIATMNLQEFPLKGQTTTNLVGSLIERMDVDVIALQEISSKGAVANLVRKLKGWTGLFTTSPSGTMSLAYLYKNSEIEIDNKETEAIYTRDNDFPRPPFKIKVRHKPTGKEVYLINVHLKAKGDQESVNRRKNASVKLKKYIDDNLDDKAVVVLGDFNDKISKSNNQIFSNFYLDSKNYRFADMHIATGSSEDFSYPSWPSHIDHVLITNELFDDVDTVMVYKPEVCAPDYREEATDHRPVVMFFK